MKADSTISRYRILRPLGSGGMGEVYEAEDPDLRRKVALKLLSPHLASHPEALERFKREARALAALNHPNIVTIFSVEEHQGTHFLTMELVEGRPLSDLIPGGGCDLGQLNAIAIPITEALAAAHEKGISHRDLEPLNVMVNDAGRVKVIDFGLAKLAESVESQGDDSTMSYFQTAAGRILGTPAYMSPEQIEGKKIDHRSDIFSLGIILTELATGQLPFVGDSPATLMSSILRDPPLPLTVLKPDLPEHLGRIIRLCLEKDPSSRYQSALDVRNELRALEEERRSGEPRRQPAGPALAPTIDLHPVASSFDPSGAGFSGARGPALRGAAVIAPEAVSVEVLKDSDVFINYAGIDDQPMLEGRQGWVSQFHRNLQVRLQQLSGEPVKIARHPGLPGGAQTDERLLTSLPAVKAMVSVVSPPFIRSESCRKGVEEFWRRAEQSGTLWVDEKARLFKVVKSPFAPMDVPPALAQVFARVFGFEFFERDPETGRVREFDEAFGAHLKQRFHERVYDLAHEVCEVLRVLRQLQAHESAITRGKGPRQWVYLATTTSDLQDERDRIRRELLERGHAVLPDAPLPAMAHDVERAVEACLERCGFAVHLLGKHYGVTPEDSAESIQALQVKLTAKRARSSPLQRILWSPGGNVSADPRQQAFLRQVEEDSELHRQADIIEGNLSLLKQDLIRRLTPPKEEKAAPTASKSPAAGVPKLYLICDPSDEAASEAIEDHLFNLGIEVCLPAFDGSEADAEALHRENLLTCDAVLVYYGAAPRAWVDIKLREVLKAPGYGRPAPIAHQAVYVAPPEDHRKERLRSHQAQVIRQTGPEVPLEALKGFAATLKGCGE
jgi:serine/threonine protein kinase